MKNKLERFVVGTILAPLAPLALFLGGWWGSFEYLPEKWIPFGAIGGLLFGIVIDAIILKRLIDRINKLGMAFWTTVYLFYSVGVFGFFMGVPVFNTFLSIPAGFVIGRKLAAENADPVQVHKTAQGTAWFSTGVLALVCTASGFIALMSRSTASDLRGMLGLGFEITPWMIIGVILVGGLALLMAGWVMTNAAVKLSFRYLQQKI